MLEIDKLSEKNLYDVLCFIFEEEKYLIQKNKKLTDVDRYYLVDYYFENKEIKIAFEFDGPTHYTQAKTQLRDIRLCDYCSENDIYLVRFPYFIQIDDRTLSYILPEEVWEKYLCVNEKYLEIKSIYKNGFWDKKIVYPGDFNPFGWMLFYTFYKGLTNYECYSVAKEIYESIEMIDIHLSLGIDLDYNEEKQLFIEHYPT